MKQCLSLGVAALFAAGACFAEPVTVRLIVLNDLDDMTAFPQVASAVSAARDQSAADGTLLLHGGDAISPSVLSSLDQGAHVIDLMNRLDIDAFTPGNHEFDFGPKVLSARMAEATFPVLSANVTTGTGETPGFALSERMVEIGGVTVGLYGLTSQDATVKSSPGDWQFADLAETGTAKAAQMRAAGADLVIAVVHAAFPEDIALGAAGIADIMASGDDHSLFVSYDGRRVIAEGAAQGAQIPVIDVTVETGEDGASWTPAFSVLAAGDFPPDAEMAAAVAGYEAVLQEALSEEIATLPGPLDTRRSTVRARESDFGNLVADAMRAATGADLAITNGGGIRGNRLYEPGTVLTARDVVVELPFGNKTVLLEMDGATLLAAFENGASRMEALDGRFLQVSDAVALVLDPTAAPGQRVVSARIDNSPLDPARRYRVATNDYLAGGGDGFGMLSDAEVILGPEDGGLMATQVTEHIRRHGAAMATGGRIVFE